jgi:hypothetical protein
LTVVYIALLLSQASVPASLQIICPPVKLILLFFSQHPRIGQLQVTKEITSVLQGFFLFLFLPHGGKDTPLQPFQGKRSQSPRRGVLDLESVCVLV